MACFGTSRRSLLRLSRPVSARQVRQLSLHHSTAEPIVVKPSQDEIRSEALSDRNLETAVRALHEDGLVVVEDVVPLDELDKLNTKMVQDALTLQARGEKSPFNYNQSNLQQDPPPLTEYFYPSIFMNPIATQISTSMLGPLPRWTFCSGNSAMPPAPTTTFTNKNANANTNARPQRQPVHSDADFAHPTHPFALVVNVPLISMTPQTGSTELWLGTHSSGPLAGLPAGLDAQEGLHGETRASGRIRPELLREREAVRPPCQPNVKRGSVVLRDLRLWHAGMPNWGDQVRVMLAMIHFAGWYRNPMRLGFEEGVRGVMVGKDGSDGRGVDGKEQRKEEEGDGWGWGGRGEVVRGLTVPVDWISREQAQASYLNRGFGNSYDFGQRS